MITAARYLPPFQPIDPAIQDIISSGVCMMHWLHTFCQYVKMQFQGSELGKIQLIRRIREHSLYFTVDDSSDELKFRPDKKKN